MPNALRPLTVGELLDRTFFLYRRHFLLFVGIAALTNLILLVFQLAQVVLSPTTIGGAITTLFWLLATILIYFITIAVSQGATIIAVSQLQLDRETSASASFAAIRPRIGELSLIVFGMGVRILVGFLLLIVPGIYLAIVWSLAIPVAVLEGRDLTRSLARSSELTKGHRGRIFVVYSLLLVLVYIVTVLLQTPTLAVVAIWAGALSAAEMPAWASVVIALSNFITTSLVSPIMTIALSLVYYDERVRKEAFDLQHMMEELDRTAAPSPAT
jgi:hypothetical protein